MRSTKHTTITSVHKIYLQLFPFDSQCCYSITMRKEAQECWCAWLASTQTVFWVASSIQSTTTLQQSLKLNQAAYSSAV